MTHTFEYVQVNGGIDTEDGYPYEARDGICRYDPKKNSSVKVNQFVELPEGDEVKLQATLAIIGPIAFAVHTPDSFMFYKTGEYSWNIVGLEEEWVVSAKQLKKGHLGQAARKESFLMPFRDTR